MSEVTVRTRKLGATASGLGERVTARATVNGSVHVVTSPYDYALSPQNMHRVTAERIAEGFGVIVPNSCQVDTSPRTGYVFTFVVGE